MPPRRPPILSIVGPNDGGEGGVDPLALQPTCDRLAEHILSPLTLSMQRPRFITAMAVGARVCSVFDDDELAADGVTPPWQVFEWYVAEALVRRTSDLAHEESGALHGVARLEAALRNQRPLRSPQCIRKPKVFGFSRIYKAAAVGLRILTQDFCLDEGGYELLRAWELDQELTGFVDGSFGAGARLRAELARAVERGMTAGHTVAPRSDFYRHIARIFWLSTIGPRESGVLHERLRRTEGLPSSGDPVAAQMRRELVDALERRGQPVAPADESAFLREVRPSASPELARRLDAIDAYEQLCRPIEHTFTLMRHLATGRGAIRASDFAAHDGTRALAERVRRAAASVSDDRALIDWAPEVQHLAERFSPVRDAASLFEVALERHEEARRHEPDGRRPWVERTTDGRVLVPDPYAVPEPPSEPTDYVHNYRTPILSRFLADLGRI